MMWLVLALLVFLAAGFVIYPLLKKPVQRAPVIPVSANVVLFRERLAELDNQLATGEIDEAQYRDLVMEQQRLLLADEVEFSTSKVTGGRGAWLLLMGLLLLPLLAFSIYQMLGARDDVVITQLMDTRANETHGVDDFAVKQQLKEKISRRLRSQPDNVYYLVILARLHMEDGNFKQASATYQQAVHLSPGDAVLLAEYAQAIYNRDGSKFESGAGAILDNVLALDPNNLTALGLQGMRFFELGDYHQAIASWQTALRIIHPGTQQAQVLQSGIARARKLLGGTLPSIEVQVTLSPEMTVSPGMVVYVYAREWQGMPMPLAVAKLQAADLPATVTLDDTMVMPGGKLLSSVETIEVVARLSVSGSATPAEGDLEGSTGALKIADHGEIVAVIIDRQL
ncbi:MAG: c-type cytochrome biogenesis protein CcmI [Porticoccus sp.]